MPRIARIGDPVWCSEHGVTHIVTGSDFVFSNDKPVATVGDRTACGATIVTGVPNQFIEGALIARRGDLISHGGHILDGCPDQWAEGEGQFPVVGVPPRPSPDEAPPENLQHLNGCAIHYQKGRSGPPPGNYWGTSISEQKGLFLVQQKDGSCLPMSAAQLVQLQRIRDGGRADEPFPLTQANVERLTQCPEPVQYNPLYGTRSSAENLQKLYENMGYAIAFEGQSPANIRQRLREGKVVHTEHRVENLWSNGQSGGHRVATLGYVADPADPDKAEAYLIHDTGWGCPAWVPADVYEKSLEPGFAYQAWITGKLPGREAAIACCLAGDLPFGNIDTRAGNPFGGMQAPLQQYAARLAEIQTLLLRGPVSLEARAALQSEVQAITQQQETLGNAIYSAQETYFYPRSAACRAQVPGHPQ
jgi:uncharacterized Zn-binding protein involved in type VI secretion